MFNDLVVGFTYAAILLTALSLGKYLGKHNSGNSFILGTTAFLAGWGLADIVSSLLTYLGVL